MELLICELLVDRFSKMYVISPALLGTGSYL